MTDEVSIVPCRSKKDWKLFEHIPELLHRELPNFVPPFPGSVSRIRKSDHPIHYHGSIHPFIAMRSGKPVGRIAGIINKTHNDFHNDRVGFFGFFDFVNDLEVAEALFDAALAVSVDNGRTSIRGPHNPTQNDECGLLIDGFDSPPFILMAYNPQYYVDVYEKLGLEKARDLYAYYIEDETEVMARTARIVERVRKKTKITFRSMDLKQLPREIRIVAELYNKMLENEWGLMPVTLRDLEYSFGDMKPILDEDMVIFAEFEGKPIGVSVTLPNVNEFMLRAKKSSGFMRLLKLGYYVLTKKPKTARLALLGVLPEFRAKGVGPVFFFESLARGVGKYDAAEISYVQDINEEIHRTAKAMGVEVYKTYRIYEKVC